MSLSGTINGSFSGVSTATAKPYITWTATQGYDGTPYSSVTATLKFVKYSTSYGPYNSAMPNTSNVNGTTNATSTAFDLRPVGTAPVYDTIRSVTVRVDHSSDGTKTCSIGWSGDTETSLGTFNFSSNVTLDTISVNPTCTTADATSVAGTTATVGGTVTDRGVPLSDTAAYYIKPSGGTYSFGSSKAHTTGAFTFNLTSLSPGTTYYYKAAVINNSGTGYGAEKYFTTDTVVPTVTTQNVSSLSFYSFTGNGNITATGGASVTRRGFCYKEGTSGDPTTSDSVVYDDGTFGTGAYSKGVTGLEDGTDYRVRAYCVNSVGTSYGTTVQATTPGADQPTVTTTTTTLLRKTVTRVGGNITDEGSASVTERGVYYGTDEFSQPTKATNGSGSGVYPVFIEGLTADTLYFYKAFATNSVGTSYGNVLKFRTGKDTPIVSGGYPLPPSNLT